ncbi:DUF192 domain-containing protein [Ilumatobacter sp.]|uniref:DUF192 domain-containing protein n=1 Tax=Ilumatobacter sp. TaxID=1967498 RepID=UPI003AF42A65
MRSAWWSVLLLSACASGSGSATDPSAPAVAAPTVTQPAAADTTVPSTGSSTAGTVDTTAPDTTSVGDVTEPAVRPEGFATTQAVVTNADGTTCEICLLLADDSAQRARGLMFVTDVGPADGMAFRYQDPHTGTFWMKNTVLPLSIAFFDPDGSFLEAFDMEPCTTDSCQKYATPRSFLVAVEVPQGDLDDVGLVAGSNLELLDIPCSG